MNDKPSVLEQRIDRLGKPFSDFVRAQTTGSLLLLAATVFALIWENSDHAGVYHRLIGMPLGIMYGNHYLEAGLQLWINEALMALFFFLLGLEIKREMLAGNLVDAKLRRLVILCAGGGMIAPALLYALINVRSGHLAGWGVPITTDTAFALGILTLLRRHIPETLFIFIVGLAIIDDIGAIVVIALFYTEHLVLYPLTAAVVLIALMALANYAGFRQPFIYILGGIATWYAVLRAGLHPTLAGVAVAMTVPARPKQSPRAVLRQAKDAITTVQTIDKPIDVLGDKQQHDLIQDVKNYADQASTPLRRWESALELPVALIVLPLFALVNAGIPINRNSLLAVFTVPVGLGVAAGLLVGKFVGISSMCWLALRRGWGALPRHVRFIHVIGASLISGMGFTMSTFIATRGLGSQPEMLQVAKTAVLMSSLLAAASGSLVLYHAGRHQRKRGSCVPGASEQSGGEVMQDKQVAPTEPDVASPRRADRQQDINDWSREVGIALAHSEGLTLTDDHWEVIEFLRHFYVEHGKPDSARVVSDALSVRFADAGGRSFLYRLFPEGPVAQGSRIAAVPVPAYSEDDSFGTAF